MPKWMCFSRRQNCCAFQDPYDTNPAPMNYPSNVKIPKKMICHIGECFSNAPSKRPTFYQNYSQYDQQVFTGTTYPQTYQPPVSQHPPYSQSYQPMHQHPQSYQPSPPPHHQSYQPGHPPHPQPYPPGHPPHPQSYPPVHPPHPQTYPPAHPPHPQTYPPAHPPHPQPYQQSAQPVPPPNYPQAYYSKGFQPQPLPPGCNSQTQNCQQFQQSRPTSHGHSRQESPQSQQYPQKSVFCLECTEARTTKRQKCGKCSQQHKCPKCAKVQVCLAGHHP